VTSLIALFRWKVSNPVLTLAAAIVGYASFPIVHPGWVLLK
jgi:hypothetical protein